MKRWLHGIDKMHQSVRKEYCVDTESDLLCLPKLDARIPEWSLHNLERRSCPFCQGQNQPALLRPDRLPIAYCGSCGLWYVCSLPPLPEITKLYQGYWFSFRPKDLSAASAAALLSDRDSMKDDVRLNRLSALSGSLTGKRLLDIGCGCGEFLVGALHRGASVFGNDVSAESCAFVRELLHIPVFEGPLSPVAFQHELGKMDIVVMSDLIEHPVDPLATFESALAVLNPDGLLLILTPNGGAAVGGLHSASQWVGFRVDLEHLQYLSAKTVATLAAQFHCDIEHLETLGYPGLCGIDRLPTGSFVADRSMKGLIKSRLKKSDQARKLVRRIRKVARAMRPFRTIPEDPRRGTYHLLAVIRKRNTT